MRNEDSAHAGQTLSASSVNDCTISNGASHEPQTYWYVGITSSLTVSIVPVDNFECTSLFALRISKIMRQQILSYLVRFRRGLSASCAGLAALILFNAIAAKHVPADPVLRASHSIPAGKTISASDFEIGQLPADFGWTGILNDPNQAVGRVTTHAIGVGAPLTLTDFVGPNLLDGLPVGTVAIALPNISAASADSVRAGDHVDIYTTGAGLVASTTRVAHNVTVVATTSAENSITAVGSRSTLLVAVNSAQVKAIAGNIGQGTFTLALLNRH